MITHNVPDVFTSQYVFTFSDAYCVVVSYHMHFISLLVPPPGKESNLNVNECSIWISKKLLDHRLFKIN